MQDSLDDCLTLRESPKSTPERTQYISPTITIFGKAEDLTLGNSDGGPSDCLEGSDPNCGMSSPT